MIEDSELSAPCPACGYQGEWDPVRVPDDRHTVPECPSCGWQPGQADQVATR